MIRSELENIYGKIKVNKTNVDSCELCRFVMNNAFDKPCHNCPLKDNEYFK